MSKKDIAAFSGTSNLPSLADFKTGLQETVTTELSASRHGEPILRLLRDGTWVFGAENIDVEEGSEWAINPLSLEHGWVSWEESKIVGEQMGPMTKPRTPRQGLPIAPGDDWQEQYAAQLLCLSGEDKGTQVIYKGTSMGLKDAFANLTPKIIRQMEESKDFVPVVTLETDFYIHKKYGKIFKPVLSVVRWIGLGGDPEAEAEPEPEPEVEEQPRRRRRRTA